MVSRKLREQDSSNDATCVALAGLRSKVEMPSPAQTGAQGEIMVDDAGLDKLKDLQAQMDKLVDKVGWMEKEKQCLEQIQKHMDDICSASRFRLEELFFQLSDQRDGKAAGIAFGLDEERIFILRQRVLERLSIEDKVQMEFGRLKAMPR